MAWNHTKRNKKKQQKKLMKAIFGRSLPLVMVLLLLIGVALGLLYEQNGYVRDLVDSLGIFSTVATTEPAPFVDPNGDEMAVHFIDVGQGDCALLQTPQGSVLIDCGSKEYGEEVVSYLSSCGVESLEYMIFTHPHEDHMGCAAYVLSEIEVKNVVMNDRISDTNYFEEAISVMEDKNINVIKAAPGKTLEVGALRLRILGPYSSKFSNEDTNNSSLIIHATYGHRAFLFTGDAEELGEKELLAHHGGEIECDVFSAGHHGASTSNSIELLEAASPEYVVISCGKNNSYGHPTAQTLSNLEQCGASYFRTDELGTIVFVTDGEELTRK